MDIWSNGTTVWVSDFKTKILYAYTLATKARDPDRDIAADSENVLPTGIWSDGTTMWVAENNRRRVFAYALADGARDESNEFELAPDIGGPWALWSDGTSLFILHPGGQENILLQYAPAELGNAEMAGAERRNAHSTLPRRHNRLHRSGRQQRGPDHGNADTG